MPETTEATAPTSLLEAIDSAYAARNELANALDAYHAAVEAADKLVADAQKLGDEKVNAVQIEANLLLHNAKREASAMRVKARDAFVDANIVAHGTHQALRAMGVSMGS